MSQAETNPTSAEKSSTKPPLPLGKILDLLESEGYTGGRFVDLVVPGIEKDEQFNPAERMKMNPNSLSFAHVLEGSLEELGILVGDLLCIDKTAAPKTGDLVVANAAGAVVHWFHYENGIYELRPVNPLLESIRSKDPASFGIWGVVKLVMRTFEWEGRPDLHLGPETAWKIVEPNGE